MLHWTNSSRNAGVVRTENMEQKVMANEKKKQTEKKLINFYGFQLRESKMERKSYFIIGDVKLGSIFHLA